MNKKIAIVVIGLIFVFILILGFPTYQRRNFQKSQISRGSIEVTVSAPGQITSENVANLSFKATGKIVYLPVKENQSVKKGEIIAALDRELLESALRQAKQDVIAADAELEKVYDDVNKTAGESFDEKIKRTAAEAKKNKAFDSVKDAEKALQNAVLSAPFAGTVTQVNGGVGEWVSSFSQEPLVTIVNFSTLYFEAKVDQEDSDEIKVGQKATLELDAKTGEKLEGEVYEVPMFTRTDSSGNVTIPVKIKINSDAFGLKVGWEGDIKIQIDEKKNVLIVPKNAVEKQKDENFVYVFGKWGVQKKPMKLGAFDGANWEVLEGLQESEEIAIKK